MWLKKGFMRGKGEAKRQTIGKRASGEMGYGKAGKSLRKECPAFKGKKGVRIRSAAHRQFASDFKAYVKAPVDNDWGGERWDEGKRILSPTKEKASVEG